MNSRRDVLKMSVPLAMAGAGVAMWDAMLGRAMAAAPGAGAMPQDAAAPLPYFHPTNFFDGNQWVLPKLPYAHADLEPHIDTATMELHHGKHHQAYVTNGNGALKAMSELGAEADGRVVESLQRDLSFNLGGHALHSLFWGTMGKPGTDGVGGVPIGRAGELITKTFGSYDRFKTYFTKVALSVKGSGWAALVYSPVSGQIYTQAIKDQDGQQTSGAMPILLVDVWEHAYYLKYQNRRRDYVEAFYNLIDWRAVNLLLGA